MVLGSPGGSRIISIVLETILNLVDYGMTPQEAVDAPRFHHQWLPDTIFAERYALSPDTVTALRAMGYTITEQNNWGAVALIVSAPPVEEKATQDRFVADSAASGTMRAEMIYGAIDARRPAGAAIGR
jgi:gamma-glutamyltranspeptidase/glutathione hydrolase